VVPADFLEVRFGAGRRLKVAQVLLALLGLLAIIITPANWVLKLGGIFLLIPVSYLVHAWSVHQSRSGVIQLFPDGRVFLRTVSGQEKNAALGPDGWVSRWLCILTLYEVDYGTKHNYVICASENHPDEYRRLLKLLRMGKPVAKAQRMIW